MTPKAWKSKVSKVVCGVLIDEEDRHWLTHSHWLDGAGYVVVYLARRNTPRLHTLICKALPGHEVDHKNGNRLDNRRSNLRSCTHADNGKNCKIRFDNVSGTKGVWWSEERKRWCVQIQANKKRLNIGRFQTLEAARAARLLAEKEYWGEFARS